MTVIIKVIRAIIPIDTVTFSWHFGVVFWVTSIHTGQCLNYKTKEWLKGQNNLLLGKMQKDGDSFFEKWIPFAQIALDVWDIHENATVSRFTFLTHIWATNSYLPFLFFIGINPLPLRKDSNTNKETTITNDNISQ